MMPSSFRATWRQLPWNWLGVAPFLIFAALFLLWPTLAGALLLVTIPIVYNNLSRDNAYPRYW